MAPRTVLMIEVDGEAPEAAERVAAALEDVTVWGEVDGVQAALLVLDLAAA